MLKLNRTRNETIGSPSSSKYLGEIDVMIAAVVCGQGFVREAIVYYKMYTNLGALAEASDGLWTWAKTVKPVEYLHVRAQVHTFFKEHALDSAVARTFLGQRLI